MNNIPLEYQFTVALYMRAWIEIDYDRCCRGLHSIVALYMRAWIEIQPIRTRAYAHTVALYMRAWIEIKRVS